jgi:hypothetical protein
MTLKILLVLFGLYLLIRIVWELKKTTSPRTRLHVNRKFQQQEIEFLVHDLRLEWLRARLMPLAMHAKRKHGLTQEAIKLMEAAYFYGDLTHGKKGGITEAEHTCIMQLLGRGVSPQDAAKQLAETHPSEVYSAIDEVGRYAAYLLQWLAGLQSFKEPAERREQAYQQWLAARSKELGCNPEGLLDRDVETRRKRYETRTVTREEYFLADVRKNEEEAVDPEGVRLRHDQMRKEAMRTNAAIDPEPECDLMMPPIDRFADALLGRNGETMSDELKNHIRSCSHCKMLLQIAEPTFEMQEAIRTLEKEIRT